LSDRDHLVAPFTGAWIETGKWFHTTPKPVVAPFTGAWIETRRRDDGDRRSTSRPSRARGSKPCRHVEHQKASCRALHGRVDRNRSSLANVLEPFGRALHGRVDRNIEVGQPL